jgi:hypothetical protein
MYQPFDKYPFLPQRPKISCCQTPNVGSEIGKEENEQIQLYIFPHTSPYFFVVSHTQQHFIVSVAKYRLLDQEVRT